MLASTPKRARQSIGEDTELSTLRLDCDKLSGQGEGGRTLYSERLRGQWRGLGQSLQNTAPRRELGRRSTGIIRCLCRRNVKSNAGITTNRKTGLKRQYNEDAGNRSNGNNN